MSGERIPFIFAAVLAASAYSIGDLVGYNFGKEDANANGRVERVQAYNEELEHQLVVGGRVVAHLRVDDTAKDFRFQTVNLGGQRERCSGQYKLRNNVATATGNLACTMMTPIS